MPTQAVSAHRTMAQTRPPFPLCKQPVRGGLGSGDLSLSWPHRLTCIPLEILHCLFSSPLRLQPRPLGLPPSWARKSNAVELAQAAVEKLKVLTGGARTEPVAARERHAPRVVADRQRGASGGAHSRIDTQEHAGHYS